MVIQISSSGSFICGDLEGINKDNNMDKIGLIYSVSSNYNALIYVLRCLEKEHIPQDKIYSIGNLIGYGKQTEKCLGISKNFCKCLVGCYEEVMLNQAFMEFTPERREIFKSLAKNYRDKLENFHKEPIFINERIILVNDQSLPFLLKESYKIKKELQKQRKIYIPYWNHELYLIGNKSLLIFGDYHFPAIYRNDKSIEYIDIDQEKVVDLNDENIKAISIGCVGFSKHFLRGYVNYAILENNLLKLCSKPFSFDKKNYSIKL